MALYQMVLGAGMKTDIKWMREMITTMDVRLTRLEQKNKATG
jgi:hypothetical protein